MSNRFGRRALLLGTAGGALALPFLASWGNDSGHGVLTKRASADNQAPKRLVMMVGWWGTSPEIFRPKNTSADGTQFELNQMMRPLESLKSKLWIPSGLNHANILATRGRGGAHEHGGASLLTSGRIEDIQKWGGNFLNCSSPSIDQAIVHHLNPTTKYKYSVNGEGSGHNHSFCMHMNGSDVGFDGGFDSPGGVFNHFFRDLTVTDGAERERVRKGRQSMLDAVMPGYQRMKARLANGDLQTLDEHLQALRELEQRNQRSFECSAPDQMSDDEWRRPDRYKKWAEINARALACDLTRVMVLAFNGTKVSVRGGMIPEADFDALNPPNFTGDPHSYGHAHRWEESNVKVWDRIQEHHMGVLAHMGTTLDGIVEANGKTVLDNSTIVYSTEIITGVHDLFPAPLQDFGPTAPPASSLPTGIPYVCLGGMNGTFKTGRHYELDKTHTYESDMGKYSHGEFLLTLARGMGVTAEQMPTFGVPEVCKNLVTEILA